MIVSLNFTTDPTLVSPHSMTLDYLSIFVTVANDGVPAVVP